MKKIKIGFELQAFDHEDSLPMEHKGLLKHAKNARKQAYAPYSNFKVGAAVLLENGEVVIGSNQENASYPSGLCAERVAVFQAGAKYPGVTIKAIAISSSLENIKTKRPAAPCGNCRQSIAEYEQKQKSAITILMMGRSGPVYLSESIADLLPLAFDNSFLSDS